MSEMKLKNILSAITARIEEIFCDKLKAVILYGSYARGDYDEESDIDIAIIADCERSDAKQYDKQLVSAMTYFMMNFDALVSFNVIPLKDFEEYKDTLPYYANIDREGVKLSA